MKLLFFNMKKCKIPQNLRNSQGILVSHTLAMVKRTTQGSRDYPEHMKFLVASHSENKD